MNKKKISIALYRLSDANLQVKAGHIIDSLTNNEYFTTPTPPLSEVRTALQDFTTATAKAKDGSRYDVVIKKEKRETLLTLLRTLALYVQLEGENNETALASSGFTLHRAPQPIGILPKPKNFKVTPIHPGAIKVSMSAVYGAKLYIYEYRIKGETAWQVVTDTRATMLFTNLTKAMEYEFRAVAIGVNPERVYTDVLSSIVL
jgi:hypothetical protein